MGDWDIDPPAKTGSSAKGPAARGREDGPWAAAAPDPGAGPASASGEAPSPVPGPSPVGVPAKRRSRLSYPWLMAAVALLLVGILAGYYIGRAQYSGDAAALAEANATIGELRAAIKATEDRNWTYYRLNQALQEQLEQAGPSTTAAPPASGDKNPFTDGVYLVGEDIPPGTYDGVVNGTVGYWARLKGTDGAIASINENGIPKGPFVVTIVPADIAVELRGVTITLR